MESKYVPVSDFKLKPFEFLYELDTEARLVHKARKEEINGVWYFAVRGSNRYVKAKNDANAHVRFVALLTDNKKAPN